MDELTVIELPFIVKVFGFYVTWKIYDAMAELSDNPVPGCAWAGHQGTEKKG